MKTCIECGNTFQENSAPQKYCFDCRMKTCPSCKIKFAPENGNHKQICCSQRCAAIIDTERIKRIIANRGTKPRTYHLRVREKHGNAFDREWRTSVFEHDHYTCQNCGQIGGRLQAHHIKPFKGHPELRYELSNGLTLCVSCHSKTDTYGWANYWKNEIAAKRMAQTVMELKCE